MSTPLLFVEGKAIVLETIVYVDFSEASVVSQNPRVKLHLLDSTTVVISDRDTIENLVKTFVPAGLQGNYASKIQIVKGII